MLRILPRYITFRYGWYSNSARFASCPRNQWIDRRTVYVTYVQIISVCGCQPDLEMSHGCVESVRMLHIFYIQVTLRKSTVERKIRTCFTFIDAKPHFHWRPTVPSSQLPIKHWTQTFSFSFGFLKVQVIAEPNSKTKFC